MSGAKFESVISIRAYGDRNYAGAPLKGMRLTIQGRRRWLFGAVKTNSNKIPDSLKQVFIVDFPICCDPTMALRLYTLNGRVLGLWYARKP